MTNKIIDKAIIKSFYDSQNSESLLEWINHKNNALNATLVKCALTDQNNWFIDDDFFLRNRDHSFFQVKGIKGTLENRFIEQPIIIQNEVGYLGFICKIIDETFKILIQAKIEPGNINKVQLSPTIQATESNFMQKHGGKIPPYFHFFEKGSVQHIIFDGKQPEQCSRFFNKFNRNIIFLTNEEIQVLPRFRWVTIGEIKKLLITAPNVVNMDTRTVLSCLPLDDIMGVFDAKNDESKEMEKVILNHRRNDNSSHTFCGLCELASWKNDNYSIKSLDENFPFSIQYFEISIDDREVKRWTQPLAVANGQALFSTLACFIDGELMLMVSIISEIGAEKYSLFGPLIQRESNELNLPPKNANEELFFSKLSSKSNVAFDILQSEEGGRFYHEQNRNVLILVSPDEINRSVKNTYLISYKCIRKLIYKGYVNIQMRSLISMIGEDLWTKKSAL